MSLPAEEPVLKGLRIVRACKANNWHGAIDAPLVDGIRQTTITATRNDEAIKVLYYGNAYSEGEYRLFDRRFNLHCASVAIEKIEGWPDIIELFKQFPKTRRPSLVETYRKLPFDHSEPNEDIMSKLIGHQLFWYSHEYARMDCDVVQAPRGPKAKQFRIADIGHRKIFHFIGTKAGFRSVLLDTIVKVG